MRHRVIREAMKEAHEIADQYGGVWYVLDDDFMSVVKESYFITDEGDRKVKPFVCLYNTGDMRYGRHTIQWIGGEIVIDSKDIKERFEQPYGTKFVEETQANKTRNVGMSTTTVLIGDPHIGRSHYLSSMMTRMHMPKMEHLMDAIELHDRLEDEGIDQKKMDKFLKDLPPMIIEESPFNNWMSHATEFSYNRIEPKRFDMATGKMVDDKPSRDMTEQKRSQLRKKRKKRKKTRR